MRSISWALSLIAAILGDAAPLRAAPLPQAAQGFAIERLRLSAPGGSWLVMDDLNWQMGLGGAAALSLGYAHRPLVIQGVPVIEHHAFAEIGLAVIYDRFRFAAHLASPVYLAGQSGTSGNFSFAAPSVNLEQSPDTIADARVGIAARLFGDPAGPVRVGASAELIFPSGNRADYSTDGTYRATGTLLFAGDRQRFSYAGHVGLHLRPLDDVPVPDTPRGNELLFGVAGGVKLTHGESSLLVGPEIYGATAFRSFSGSDTSALEGLLTVTLDTLGPRPAHLGIKVGGGAGIHPQFGAPRWRMVIAIELRGHVDSRTAEKASPP